MSKLIERIADLAYALINVLSVCYKKYYFYVKFLANYSVKVSKSKQQHTKGVSMVRPGFDRLAAKEYRLAHPEEFEISLQVATKIFVTTVVLVYVCVVYCLAN